MIVNTTKNIIWAAKTILQITHIVCSKPIQILVTEKIPTK